MLHWYIWVIIVEYQACYCTLDRCSGQEEYFYLTNVGDDQETGKVKE